MHKVNIDEEEKKKKRLFNKNKGTVILPVPGTVSLIVPKTVPSY